MAALLLTCFIWAALVICTKYLFYVFKNWLKSKKLGREFNNFASRPVGETFIGVFVTLVLVSSFVVILVLLVKFEADHAGLASAMSDL